MLTTVDTDYNKKIAKQFLQFVNEGKVEELCEMVTPTWKMHGGLPGLPEGPRGIRMLFDHFDNIEQEWTIEDVIAEDDKVVVRGVNTCTQDSFLGFPAKGIKQKFTAIFIHEIIDGKINETWRNANDLARLQQIGVAIAKVAPDNT